MMGTVVPETCWAYKKYNKIISGIYFVFILQLPLSNSIIVQQDVTVYCIQFITFL